MRRIALSLIALVALGAGALGWYVLRPERSLTGAALGRLRLGVTRANLNLLVVTLDTTRADRLGAYGYTGAQTPTIDRLARDGVLFEQAITSAPLTLPAHSTLFTGRFPPAHVLDGKWGLNQGFDTYVDDFDLSRYRAISLGDIQRPANEVMDSTLKWLDEARSSRFFAWVHLYDPHTPYEAPELYRSRFPGKPYDAEIAFADAQLGRLIDYLGVHDLLDRTVFVVVGAHGESLGDHGEQSHGFFIYESVIRVPLIIRAPYSGMQGRRVADPVRSADVMPTALDLLGVPVPSTVEGRSFVPLMTGDATDLGLETYTEATYPLHHFGWSDLRALRSGRFKLIAAPRPELYDLQNDPDEARNIFTERR